MHENALTILKKLAYVLFLPFNFPFIPLTLFFVLPLALSAALILFGVLIRKYMPALFHFLFGR